MSRDVSSKPAANVSIPAVPAETQPLAGMLKRLQRGELGQLPVVLTILIIAVYFQIASGGFFLVPRNLSNLTLQIATIGTLALGAVLVLLIGEIDLSLAAVSNLCGATMVVLSVYHGWPAIPALLAGMAVGLAIGALNGFFVAVLGVPSFIVTLAGFIFYSGLLLHVLLPNTTIRLIDPTLTGIATTYVTFPWDAMIPVPIIAIYIGAMLWNRTARKNHGLEVNSLAEMWLQAGVVIVLTIGAVTLFESAYGVPYSTLVLVSLIAIFWLIMRFTGFGRHIYAVGGNSEASRRAGINVTMVRIAVFSLASMLAGIGGILESSRTISASAQVSNTLLLNAIAAAVIGGVSLFGGRGSVWAVVLGVLVIGSLANGLTLLGQSDDIQLMVEGAVLLVAVTADALARRRNARTGR